MEELFAERYVRKKLLGRGGMGKVYLVEDLLLAHELVALKVLHARADQDEKNVQRFLREIQLTRRFANPHVIRTFDAGLCEGNMYFTMEYVDGYSLKDRLKQEGPLDPMTVAGFMSQICSGLAAIHSASVVHRDLKPSNIMVDSQETAKITDFGVARASMSDLTGGDELVGSTAYISPEVWAGREIGSAADLYALGVLAYELLTGDLPFRAESPAELMWKHLECHPPEPATLAEVPQWLNLLVMLLLEKDPNRRPCDALEVAAYIDDALAGHELPSDSLEKLCASSEMAPSFGHPVALAEGYVPSPEHDFDDDLGDRLGLGAKLPQTAFIPIEKTPAPLVETPAPSEPRRKRVLHFAGFLLSWAATFVVVAGTTGVALPLAAHALEQFWQWGSHRFGIEFVILHRGMVSMVHIACAAVPILGLSVQSFSLTVSCLQMARAFALYCCAFALFVILYLSMIFGEILALGLDLRRAAFWSAIDSANVNLLQTALLMPRGTEYSVKLENGLAGLSRLGTGQPFVRGIYLIVVAGFVFLLLGRILPEMIGRGKWRRASRFRWGALASGVLLTEWIAGFFLPGLLALEQVRVHRIGYYDVPISSYQFWCAAVNWSLLFVFAGTLSIRRWREEGASSEQREMVPAEELLPPSFERSPADTAQERSAADNGSLNA